MQVTERYLLDTCVWLWIAEKNPRIKDSLKQKLEKTEWLLSIMSIWEIAMLEKKKRLTLHEPIEIWVKNTLQDMQELKITQVSPEILISSCNLIQYEHNDPIDRIIIATAIHHDVPLVTADQHIIAYRKTKKINVIAI